MRPLQLGIHWGGGRGGLDRYFTELTSNLVPIAQPTVVVLGPAEGAPPYVHVGGDDRQPLPLRLVANARAVGRASPGSDVVVAHFALFAWIPIHLIPRVRKLPFVVHFHGPWADESRAEGGGRRASVSVKRWVERTVYRRAARVITDSSAFRDLIVERYGVAPERVLANLPGVELSRFSPRVPAPATPIPFPDDAFVAFAVRRLVPRMGLDVLIHAWSRLDTNNASHLVIAGDGPERAGLEKLAASLGAADRVHFAGRVSDADLVTWYRAADLTVVPSVELEGFGLVVLESLACGTPVVGTDVGGLPEVLGPFEPTLIVPPRDPVALAERLTEAIDRRESLPTSGDCRAYAERFSWAATARRSLDVYTDALAPPRRRVVFTDHCATLSGAEISLLRLAPEVARHWDVHVVLGEDGPLADELRAAGVAVTILALSREIASTTRARSTAVGMRPATILGTLGYSVRLSRLLRTLRADVVQSNSLKSAYYTSVAARLSRTPFVWAAKDRVAPDYLPERAVQVTRIAASYASAVVANSRSTLETLTRSRPGQLRAVVGEPPSAGTASAAARRDGPLRIGIVGRIAPWKGQDVFIEAFALAFADGDEQAVIVGAPMFGEDDYEAALHRQASDLGMAHRFVFRGFQSDVVSELADIDILVHASVIPEPFGIVVVEGMAAGLPVIATDAGGPAEIITSGLDGVLVPPQNIAALSEAMRELANDPATRARIAARAQQRAKAFAADSIAGELVDIYTELVGRR